MVTKKLLYLLGTFLIAGSILQAQETNLFYFNPLVPQAVYSNPAMHNTQRKVVLGLAGFNGFYADFNSDVSISELLFVNDEGSTVFDPEYMAKNMQGNGEIRQTFSLPLLFLGLNFNRNHFFFAANEKEPFTSFFNDDMVTFLSDGNKDYKGRTISPEFDISLLQYTELAFGYSRDLLDRKLQVGASAKLLFGKAALTTSGMRMDIYTEPSLDYMTFTGQGTFHAAGPMRFETNGSDLADMRLKSDFAFGSYVGNFSNPGFAFDLGAKYQVNPKVGVSASVTDIGKIFWKGDASAVDIEGMFNWQGADISEAFKPGYTFVSNETGILDSIVNSYKVSEGVDEFTTSLATKLYLGGTFTLNDTWDFGVLNRVQFNPVGTTANMFMVSANATINDVLSVSSNYAVTKGSYNNLGLGFAVRAGFAQFVLGTGNVISLIDWKHAQYASVRFGINLMFGKIVDESKVLKEEIDESL